MLNFTDTKLSKIIIHHIGNKNKNEGIKLSKNLLKIKDDDLLNLLKAYFTNPFKTEALYHFNLYEEAKNNVVFRLASEVFDNNELLFDNSVKLAHYLHENSEYPKINAGEFYVVYFKDCVIDDELTDAIGLFKSENKDTYLKVFQNNNTFDIAVDEGINIHKLDKGCIIFNTEKENGYLVSMVDNLNKNSDLQPWKDDFFHTQSLLNVCKGFCDEMLSDDKEVSKQNQFNIKDRSMKYFVEHDNFNQKEFETEVMQEPEIIEAFQHYKQQYINKENSNEVDDFGISDSAVKSAKKYFKSILKLDKNFHVYVHGNADMLEKGFDEKKKMNFYRLFFNEEI